MMRVCGVFLLAGAMGLSACKTLETTKKSDKAKQKEREKNTMPDASGDVSYQSFVGLLRKAIEEHDVATLASMMTPNFGYCLDPLKEGEGVFQYWEENGLWSELQLVVNEKFMPLGNFMVAPPQFATDPNYAGYRLGITRAGGSWRFAYFVKG